MTNTLPRPIRPELIEIGDKVRVTFPTKKGVTMTHEGVVSSRVDHGAVRFLYTEEGATLFSWQVGKSALRVLLLDRPPAPQEPLSLFTEVLERTG